MHQSQLLVKMKSNEIKVKAILDSTPFTSVFAAVDQSKLMKNVVFVLSGFQNPLRAELRNKATTMGAIYNDDWDGTCTHLMYVWMISHKGMKEIGQLDFWNFSCAFPNTPKFTQVKQTGKGVIVGKQWILDCYKQKQLLFDKNYELKGSDNTPKKAETPGRTSEKKMLNFDDNDDEEENQEPIISKDVTRKSSIKKKMTTFDDEDDEDEDAPPVIGKNTKANVQPKKNTATFDDDDDDGNLDTPPSQVCVCSPYSACVG